jgi:hypothetical protein
MRVLAEREGFEPPIRLPVCRISSAVQSTTLPPLQASKIRHFSQRSILDCYRFATLSIGGPCLERPVGHRQPSQQRRPAFPAEHDCRDQE